jgi:fumarate hydratase subunit alpha
MRIVSAEQITAEVSKLCIEANIIIGEDIAAGLSKAKEKESCPLAESALESILENAETAKRERLPLCQDTGMAVVFVEIGCEVRIEGNIGDAINEGVRRGYRDGYFRNSVVEPLNRINTGDNTPCVIHYDFVNGDRICITVSPKGFGSENMSALRMFTPSEGIEAKYIFPPTVVQITLPPL